MKHKTIKNFFRDLYTEAVPNSEYWFFLRIESFRRCADNEDILHFALVRHEIKHVE